MSRVFLFVCLLAYGHPFVPTSFVEKTSFSSLKSVSLLHCYIVFFLKLNCQVFIAGMKCQVFIAGGLAILISSRRVFFYFLGHFFDFST